MSLILANKQHYINKNDADSEQLYQQYSQVLR